MHIFTATHPQPKQYIVMACLVMVLGVSLVFGPLSQSAAAVTCRNTTFVAHSNDSYMYKNHVPYQRATLPGGFDSHRVPDSNVSGCSYINVTNITGGWGPGGHCWSFIIYYPLTGVWGNESGYCAGPDDVIGIAGPVANGTYYAVGFVPNNNLRFTIRD